MINVHEKWKIKHHGPRVVLNIGVDQWNFYPVGFQEIKKFLEGT